MILAWPDVLKSPADVKNVSLDWTSLLPAGTLAIASHSVAVDVESLSGSGYGDFIPIGMGGVSALDKGVSGLVQTIQISGGNLDSYSVVFATAGLADGTQLTRCFKVLVR